MSSQELRPIQLLSCSDTDFDNNIKNMTVKDLMGLISTLQKEMAKEQENFNGLSSALQGLKDRNSRQYKTISRDMVVSQGRLTTLMNRSMKCFSQQNMQQNAQGVQLRRRNSSKTVDSTNSSPIKSASVQRSHSLYVSKLVSESDNTAIASSSQTTSICTPVTDVYHGGGNKTPSKKVQTQQRPASAVGVNGLTANNKVAAAGNRMSADVVTPGVSSSVNSINQQAQALTMRAGLDNEQKLCSQSQILITPSSAASSNPVFASSPGQNAFSLVPHASSQSSLAVAAFSQSLESSVPLPTKTGFEGLPSVRQLAQTFGAKASSGQNNQIATATNQRPVIRAQSLAASDLSCRENIMAESSDSSKVNGIPRKTLGNGRLQGQFVKRTAALKAPKDSGKSAVDGQTKLEKTHARLCASKEINLSPLSNKPASRAVGINSGMQNGDREVSYFTTNLDRKKSYSSIVLGQNTDFDYVDSVPTDRNLSKPSQRPQLTTLRKAQSKEELYDIESQTRAPQKLLLKEIGNQKVDVPGGKSSVTSANQWGLKGNSLLAQRLQQVTLRVLSPQRLQRHHQPRDYYVGGVRTKLIGSNSYPNPHQSPQRLIIGGSYQKITRSSSTFELSRTGVYCSTEDLRDHRVSSRRAASCEDVFRDVSTPAWDSRLSESGVSLNGSHTDLGDCTALEEADGVSQISFGSSSAFHEITGDSETDRPDSDCMSVQGNLWDVHSRHQGRPQGTSRRSRHDSGSRKSSGRSSPTEERKGFYHSTPTKRGSPVLSIFPGDGIDLNFPSIDPEIPSDRFSQLEPQSFPYSQISHSKVRSDDHAAGPTSSVTTLGSAGTARESSFQECSRIEKQSTDESVKWWVHTGHMPPDPSNISCQHPSFSLPSVALHHQPLESAPQSPLLGAPDMLGRRENELTGSSALCNNVTRKEKSVDKEEEQTAARRQTRTRSNFIAENGLTGTDASASWATGVSEQQVKLSSSQLQQETSDTVSHHQTTAQQERLETVSHNQTTAQQEALDTVSHHQTTTQQEALDTVSHRQITVQQEALDTVSHHQTKAQQQASKTVSHHQTTAQQEALDTVSHRQITVQQEALDTVSHHQTTAQQQASDTVSHHQTTAQQEALDTVSHHQTTAQSEKRGGEDELSIFDGESCSPSFSFSPFSTDTLIELGNSQNDRNVSGETRNHYSGSASNICDGQYAQYSTVREQTVVSEVDDDPTANDSSTKASASPVVSSTIKESDVLNRTMSDDWKRAGINDCESSSAAAVLDSGIKDIFSVTYLNTSTNAASGRKCVADARSGVDKDGFYPNLFCPEGQTRQGQKVESSREPGPLGSCEVREKQSHQATERAARRVTAIQSIASSQNHFSRHDHIADAPVVYGGSSSLSAVATSLPTSYTSAGPSAALDTRAEENTQCVTNETVAVALVADCSSDVLNYVDRSEQRLTSFVATVKVSRHRYRNRAASPSFGWKDGSSGRCCTGGGSGTAHGSDSTARITVKEETTTTSTPRLDSEMQRFITEVVARQETDITQRESSCSSSPIEEASSGSSRAMAGERARKNISLLDSLQDQLSRLSSEFTSDVASACSDARHEQVGPTYTDHAVASLPSKHAVAEEKGECVRGTGSVFIMLGKYSGDQSSPASVSGSTFCSGSSEPELKDYLPFHGSVISATRSEAYLSVAERENQQGGLSQSSYRRTANFPKQPIVVASSTDLDDSDGRYSSISTTESSSDRQDHSDSLPSESEEYDNVHSFHDFVWGLEGQSTSEQPAQHSSRISLLHNPIIQQTIMEADDENETSDEGERADSPISSFKSSLHFSVPSVSEWKSTDNVVRSSPSVSATSSVHMDQSSEGSGLLVHTIDSSNILDPSHAPCASLSPSDFSEGLIHLASVTAEVRKPHVESGHSVLSQLSPPANTSSSYKSQWMEEKSLLFEKLLRDFMLRSEYAELSLLHQMGFFRTVHGDKRVDWGSSKFQSALNDGLYSAFTREFVEKGQNHVCPFIEDFYMPEYRFRRFLNKKHNSILNNSKAFRIRHRLEHLNESLPTDNEEVKWAGDVELSGTSRAPFHLRYSSVLDSASRLLSPVRLRGKLVSDVFTDDLDMKRSVSDSAYSTLSDATSRYISDLDSSVRSMWDSRGDVSSIATDQSTDNEKLMSLSDVFDQFDVCEGEIDHALLDRLRVGHYKAACGSL